MTNKINEWKYYNQNKLMKIWQPKWVNENMTTKTLCTKKWIKKWKPKYMNENMTTKVNEWNDENQSKVGDLSRGWPEGSLFNSYYTEV